MTFSELIASLPHGLHDTDLKTVSIDYVHARVLLSVDVWIGRNDALEAYRSAEIALADLCFWIIEPASVPYELGDGLMIDVGSMDVLRRPPSLPLPPVPESANVNWIFVHNWNAFIYVAAGEAVLRWVTDEWVDDRSPSGP